MMVSQLLSYLSQMWMDVASIWVISKVQRLWKSSNHKPQKDRKAWSVRARVSGSEKSPGAWSPAQTVETIVECGQNRLCDSSVSDPGNLSREQKGQMWKWHDSPNTGIVNCGSSGIEPPLGRCFFHMDERSTKADCLDRKFFGFVLFSDIDRSSGQPTSIWQEAAVRGKAREECGDTWVKYVKQFVWNYVYNLLNSSQIHLNSSHQKLELNSNFSSKESLFLNNLKESAGASSRNPFNTY